MMGENGCRVPVYGSDISECVYGEREVESQMAGERQQIDDINVFCVSTYRRAVQCRAAVSLPEQ